MLDERMKEAREPEVHRLSVEERARFPRQPRGWWSEFLWALGAGFSLLFLYTAFYGQFATMQQRGALLIPALIMAFLYYPALRKKPYGWGLILDSLLALLATFCVVWGVYRESSSLLLTVYTNFDIAVGAVIIILVLEAGRRVLGWPMVILTAIFLVYGYVGPWMPGLLSHPGFSVRDIIEYISIDIRGIYGLPLGVVSTVVVLFIVFAAFLKLGGAGEFFIKLPMALFGGTRGGPAKMAVVGSSLFGTMSGSVVANVSGTGTFTIPLMKRTGYPPHVAGAIEAITSTGGCIMPPVMGAAAFIMAEILGVSYWNIVVAAFIPAVLYYVGIFAVVDLEAAKRGLSGLPKAELPPRLKTFKEGWFLLVPLAVLVLMLSQRYSPLYASGVTIVLTVLVTFFSKEHRMGPRKIYDALALGMQGMILVTIICACAGMIIGIVTMSGVTLRLSSMLIALSHGHVFILLLLTMLACTLFGMGVPVTASYIFLAILVAPALVMIGVNKLAAHLFIFHMASLSSITPPVAVGAYAAAAVAGTGPMKVAFTAVRLAIIAWVVPYIFVYYNSLLLMGTPGIITIDVIAAIVGVCSFVILLVGYFVRPLPIVPRTLFGVAGLGLLLPVWQISLVAAVLLAVLVITQVKPGLLARVWRRQSRL